MVVEVTAGRYRPAMALEADVVTRRGPPGRLGTVRMAGRVAGARGAPPGRTVRFASFGLTFLWGGAGRYRDRAHDVGLRAGSLVLVFPGHPHWYGAVGGAWDEVFVVFDGPLFDLARRTGVLDPARPVVQLEAIDHWHDRFDAFRRRPAPRTASGSDREACELLGALTTLGDPPTDDVADADWYARSCELLGADLDRACSPVEVAEAVGMPYETWRRRFAARAGCPPAAYRLRRRIDAAAALARDTSLSSREIAAVLGFSDEQHLTRHFRALLGTTPRRYREAHR